ncbi:autotransporter outer membrane beta-barrel domain-containing protein [Chryseobacterium paridis]|uniref:Uncharacterized protein n=1 Tax=Chryseobacterium paridis TaxID=2800328 RepID=A0ABS1FYZ8_9FLAO|nr:hypothetical protein [Chryseobacterium paridis]MBK1897642.1 hypothetical protein [Chryseobacterium paridis]
MKTKTLFLLLIALFETTYAQIGIGTPNPRGALDINKPTTNIHGLVLPTNSSTGNIANPQGGNVAIGTIIYDSTADCVKVYKSTGWSNCLCDSCDGTTVVPITSLDCTNGALAGTYTQGTTSNGTKVINYTGGSGQAYGAINVSSTGVTGLTATAPAGTFANGNGSITLQIEGTPNTSGTASFTINLGGKSCTFTINVGNNGPVVATLNCTNGALTGTYTQGTLVSNETKVINYTGGNGRPYGAISINSTGVTGLTATSPAGTLTNANGSITLTINGTPSNSGTANFTVNFGGQSCTFSITVQPKTARRITILSLTPDNWRSNLSSDSYTSVARSKLNNSSNFGPSGTVKIEGFNYRTVNVSNSSDQAFRDAIDNADIIWVGYITNRNFPQSKRNILAQKIAEKKKFFYLGADGHNSFFPFTSFAGYSFQSTPNNRRNAKTSASNVGPTSGIFGNIPTGSTIFLNRYIGAISHPSSASPFMNTEGGRTTGIINDNLIIIGDINWYINRDRPDGFTGGSSSCTENNNSRLFCNILEKAVEYVLTH